MEIRLLNANELELAANTVRDIYEKTIAARASKEEKKQFYEYVNGDFFWVEVCKKHLYIWGAFENQSLCAVSAMQNVGHITLLYTMPQFQKKGIGSALLNEMRRFALESLRLEFVTVNAMPAFTADFFEKNGFVRMQGVIQQASFVSLECMLNTQQSTQPQQSTQSQQSVQLQQNAQQQSEQPPYEATYYNYEEPVKVRKGINGACMLIILYAALCLIVLAIVLIRYSYIQKERNNRFDGNTDWSWSIETGEEFEIETEDEIELGTEECCNGELLPDNLGREIVFLEDEIYVADELDYEIRMETLSVHEEIENGEYDIEVEYPQVVYSDGRDASEINEILRSAACLYADRMYPEIQEQYMLYDEGDYKQLETEVAYEITYMSNDLLCVGFDEHYFLGHWAAEYSDIRTRCINLQTGECYEIEDILSHDEDFDKCYFEKICEINEEFLTTSAFDQNTAARTLDGEVVEGRFFSNYLIGKDVFQINLTYHYGDGSLIMRGWLSTAFSHEEYDSYRNDSEFWELYGY